MRVGLSVLLLLLLLLPPAPAPASCPQSPLSWPALALPCPALSCPAPWPAPALTCSFPVLPAMMHDSFCTRAFRLEEDMSRCAAKPSVHSVVMIYTDRPPSSISLVMSLIAGSALHSRSPLSHPLSAAVLCCAVPSCPVLSCPVRCVQSPPSTPSLQSHHTHRTRHHTTVVAPVPAAHITAPRQRAHEPLSSSQRQAPKVTSDTPATSSTHRASFWRPPPSSCCYEWRARHLCTAAVATRRSSASCAVTTARSGRQLQVPLPTGINHSSPHPINFAC